MPACWGIHKCSLKDFSNKLEKKNEAEYIKLPVDRTGRERKKTMTGQLSEYLNTPLYKYAGSL